MGEESIASKARCSCGGNWFYGWSLQDWDDDMRVSEFSTLFCFSCRKEWLWDNRTGEIVTLQQMNERQAARREQRKAEEAKRRDEGGGYRRLGFPIWG